MRLIEVSAKALLLAIPGTIAQLVQTVAVGRDGLLFTPSSISAPPGSQIEFQYYSHNHSVVSSSYDNPCQPDGRLFSGYMPVSSGMGVRRQQTHDDRVDLDTDVLPARRLCDHH